MDMAGKGKQAARLLALVVILMSDAGEAAAAIRIEKLAPCGPWAPGQPRAWCVQARGLSDAIPQVLLGGREIPASRVTREGRTLHLQLPERPLDSGSLWLRDGMRISNPVWLSTRQSYVLSANSERQVPIADHLVTSVDLLGLLLHEDVQGQSQAQRIAKAHGLQIVGAIPPLNLYQVRLSSSTLLERNAMVQALEQDQAVEAVLVEDDNRNDGQKPYKAIEPPDDDGWAANRFDQGVDLYRRYAAWEHRRPGPVSVGVIEKGVNFDSPDFTELVAPCGHAGVSLQARHSRPKNAHGSIVTGILSARIAEGGNRGLLSRIGPMGRGFRVIVDIGGETGVVGRVAASVNLVQDQVRVLNWSWGVHRMGRLDLKGQPITANVRSDLAFEGYRRLLVRFFAWLKREHPEVLVVNSAGNSASSTDDHLPASLSSEQLLVVGAHQRSGRDVGVEDARFVVRRGNSNLGPRVDITAAACPRPPQTTAPRAGSGGGCGTSYSAALVTAVAAAMVSINPDLQPAQIKALLRRSALPAQAGLTAPLRADERERSDDPAIGLSSRLDMLEAMRLVILGGEPGKR
ncbi:S8/S53 family peptidase [Pseudomonas sp. S31]|uniref:S8/S53 family peptidase n=1 Tax=Pseudomonas sp. S31 TaxID=1564473 RepID=UPI001F217A2F|nr:S8/S53 family peptidase [Pseudomonas sp. S31]